MIGSGPSPFGRDGGQYALFVHYNHGLDTPVHHPLITRAFAKADLPRVWAEVGAGWIHSQAYVELLERIVVREGRVRGGEPITPAEFGKDCAWYTNDGPAALEGQYVLVTVGEVTRFRFERELTEAARSAKGEFLGARVIATLFWHIHM